MAFSDRVKFFFRRKKTLVGKDEYGNTYYEMNDKKIKKRWVIYNGIAEPTKIPPNWHLWLHYTDNSVPKERDNFIRYMPNFIDIQDTYSSNCFLLNQHNSITYKSWNPNG